MSYDVFYSAKARDDLEEIYEYIAVDEEKKNIHIIRIMYGGRDIDKQLNEY